MCIPQCISFSVAGTVEKKTAKGRKFSNYAVDQGNKLLTVQVAHSACTSPLGTQLCSDLQADMNLLSLCPSQLKTTRHIAAESDLKYQLHQSAY